MKLLGTLILYKEDDTNVKSLQNEYKLDHISRFQRDCVRSFFIFSAKTAIERTASDTRKSIELDENSSATMHVNVRRDGLAAAVISSNDYPKRVAHTLLNKIMDEFTMAYPSTSWQQMKEGSGKMTSLSDTLEKYQNPETVDPLTSLQKDLDDTREIMINTIDQVLRRGEKVDDLVEKSNELNLQTKLFYKTARKNNRCCSLF